MSPNVPPAAAWIAQTMGLLHVAQRFRLPAPIATSWDPYRQELSVQVQEDAYRPWMEAMSSPVVRSEPHEGATHLYAHGELRACRMVKLQLIAVCHQVGAS